MIKIVLAASFAFFLIHSRACEAQSSSVNETVWTDNEIASCLKKDDLQPTNCWPKFVEGARYPELKSPLPFSSQSVRAGETFSRFVRRLCGEVTRDNRPPVDDAIHAEWKAENAKATKEFMDFASAWSWSNVQDYKVKLVNKILSTPGYKCGDDTLRGLYREFIALTEPYENYRIARLEQYMKSASSLQVIDAAYFDSRDIRAMTLLGRDPYSSKFCYYQGSKKDFERQVFEYIDKKDLPEQMRLLMARKINSGTVGSISENGVHRDFTNYNFPLYSSDCGVLISFTNNLKEVKETIEKAGFATWIFDKPVVKFSTYADAKERREADYAQRREKMMEFNRANEASSRQQAFLSGSQKRILSLLVLSGSGHHFSGSSAARCGETIRDFEYGSTDYTRRALVNACKPAVYDICNVGAASEALCREGRIVLQDLSDTLRCNTQTLNPC